MNRLIARPVVQLARRPLISSAETGGHAWYRTGFTAFKSHPSIFRYLGMIYFAEFKKLKKKSLKVLVLWQLHSSHHMFFSWITFMMTVNVSRLSGIIPVDIDLEILSIDFGALSDANPFSPSST